MKTYKLESGIKIPPIIRTNGGENKLSRVAATLQLMKKGESFLIKDPLEALKATKVMRDAMTREREIGGKRTYTSRKVGNGCRIWREK